MFFIYVLHSQMTGRFYTGLTSDLQARMLQHNSGQSISTKNRGPWDLVYSERFETLSEAVRRERYLKTGKGRDEIKQSLAKNSTIGLTGYRSSAIARGAPVSTSRTFASHRMHSAASETVAQRPESTRHLPVAKLIPVEVQ